MTVAKILALFTALVLYLLFQFFLSAPLVAYQRFLLRRLAPIVSVILVHLFISPHCILGYCFSFAENTIPHPHAANRSNLSPSVLLFGFFRTCLFHKQFYSHHKSASMLEAPKAITICYLCTRPEEFPLTSACTSSALT